MNNDYRRGNLIRDHENIVVIESLNDQGVNLFSQIIDTEEEDGIEVCILPSITYDELTPIEITTKRLIQLGFVQISKKIWKIGDRNTNEIYVRPHESGGWYWGIYDRIDDHYEEIEYRAELYEGVILKYIHQIQNHYFALTEKELISDNLKL